MDSMTFIQSKKLTLPNINFIKVSTKIFFEKLKKITGQLTVLLLIAIRNIRQ